MRTKINIPFFLISLVCIINSAFAQNPSQVIKGTVADKQSQAPLPIVTVFIIGSDPVKAAISDVDGHFKIENVSPGRYDLKINLTGYKEQVVPNVMVTSGKEVILDIALEETISNLTEVVVAGTKKNETNNTMTSVSGRSFSMEEVNRYSGGRSDPARLVANFAGVNAPNDFKNDIVVRGNSPLGVLWRVEGLNIPSPNHFSTLGAMGGPVTIMNNNVLRNSDFFSSAFAAEYGNATSGVFDVGYRNGNTEKAEHSLQFGLLTGLEAMTEGPLKKGSSASYLLTYRYSFMAVADKMGIPLGVSSLPHYQDLSFKINSGETKLGRFTLFGSGGISSIEYKHDHIDSTDLFADPKRDSYIKSRLSFTGLKNTKRINAGTFWNTVIGVTYSGANIKDDTIQAPMSTAYRISETKTSETKYLLNTFINSKINKRLTLKAGIQADCFNLDLFSRTRETSPDWDYIFKYKNSTLLLGAYTQVNYKISEKIVLNAGLRSQYLTLNTNSKSIEPRIGAKFLLNEKNTLSLGYGYHSQMQPLNVYFYRGLNPDGSYNESNRDLGFTNSQHLVLGYDVLPFQNWRIKTEVYYQRISNAPISKHVNSFSMLNEGASYIQTNAVDLTNKGTGSNYGLELTLERFFSKGFYALVTGSLYESKYKGSDNKERNTTFNGNYVYNVLAGKEFKVGKAKRNAITVDLKVTQSGGRRYTPVDIAASQAAKSEILMGDEYAFTKRYPDFLRVDTKIGFVYNSKKRKLTHAIYYDLQNITNNKNVFAQQYNKVTNTVNTAYQMGFFPNFMYKIQF